MSKNIKDQIIEQLLLEVCAHSKVEDGIVNFEIQEHVDALIEVLKKTSMPVEVIRMVTNSLNEGKHPERQAYNREGFLVTFPTPEYKKQALASGEYTNQDPTHGKGGMHLVKKVEPVDAPVPTKTPSQEPAPKTSNPSQPSSGGGSESKPTTPSPTPAPTTPSPTPAPTNPSPAAIKTAAPKAPTPAPTPAKTSGGATQYTTGVPVDPSIDLNLDKISDYRDPSLEWSHNKKWQKRENNNYYDAQGNLKAITGLDGTVVPVSEEERVDLKKFIEDKKKEKLGIQPSEEPKEKEAQPS